MDSKTSPWTVICPRKNQYFNTREEVVEFIARRNGNIGAIVRYGRLIPDELKIYHEAMYGFPSSRKSGVSRPVANHRS